MKSPLHIEKQSLHRRIVRNSSYSLINTIGSNVVNLFCVVLLARYLGARDYGVIIFANYLMLFVFGVFGNDLSGVKLLSESTNDHRQLGTVIKGIVIYHFIFAFCCIFLLSIFFLVSRSFIPLNIHNHLLSISIIVIVNLFVSMFGSLWDGFLRMDWAMLADVTLKLVKLVCFIVLIWAGSGLVHILWSWAGIYCFYTILVLPLLFRAFVRKRTRVTPSISLKGFPHRNYLIYGFFLKFPGIVRSFVPLIVSFYLGYIMVDSSKIGLYGAAAGIASGTLMLAGSLGRVLFPSLSQFYGDGKWSYFVETATRAYRYTALPVFVGISIIILWRRNLVQLIYGEDFVRASHILGYLCIAAFFESLKYINGVILNAANRASVITVVEGIGAVLIATIGFMLIKYYELMGAAGAVAMVSVITAVIEMGLIHKLLKIKMSQVIVNSTAALIAFLIVINWHGAILPVIILITAVLLLARNLSLHEVVGLLALMRGR